MKRIFNCNGLAISGQKEVLEEQKRFYQALYTTNEKVVFNLKPIPGERLLTEEAQTLENPITYEELHSNLLAMTPNKCPGIDGLTKEFYVKFFDLLGPILVKVYNHAYTVGELNPTARICLISLLPKPGKDLMHLKSWRALTILNLDYKIISKTMAERLKTVLPLIISEEQCGFMKGRHITDCIRHTIEVVQYTKKSQTPEVLMSIDFFKCFDMLEH